MMSSWGLTLASRASGFSSFSSPDGALGLPAAKLLSGDLVPKRLSDVLACTMQTSTTRNRKLALGFKPWPWQNHCVEVSPT
jgi:hypothetical protein